MALNNYMQCPPARGRSSGIIFNSKDHSMPNEYANIKQTAEYRQAKAEVEAMIKHAVTPLESKLNEMTAVVLKLQKTVADLEARLPKQ